MSTAAQAAERSAEIARILETESDLKAFQQHLEEVLCGEAFRGSHRSVQFLRYVINQSVNGHCDELKERLIGVELFGRSPSYDTGEDAIVRVTASDVRRRLLQHYGRYGSPEGLRISLPLGSYIPMVTRESAPKSDSKTGPFAETLVHAEIVSTHSESRSPHGELPQAAAIPQHPPEAAPPEVPRANRRALGIAVLLAALVFFIAGLVAGREFAQRDRLLASLPWSVFVNSPHATEIITSDPTIAEVQELTGSQISVSDYANGSS